ncbi:MAG: c-type cytochrome [Nitrosomonas sp.]
MIAAVRQFLPFLLLGLALLYSLHAVEAAAETNLGRSIYEKGIGRDGRDISAVVHGSVRLNGAAIACGGCHGKQGRGGGEAFIQAPDVRWLSLSKHYPARRIGSAEVSYDDASFTRALRTGLTAAGRTLDPAMPRFDLADDEIRSLIAYLEIVDDAEDANQTQPVILGLLPTPGQHPLTDALDAKLRNCAVSRNGTLIAAIDMIYFDTPKDAIAKLNDRLSAFPASVILAPFLAGWEQAYHQAIRHTDAMTVLPFSLRDPFEEHQWQFPFPGLESQIMALLKSAQTSEYRHVQLRYDPDNSLSKQLASIAREMIFSLNLSLLPERNEKMPETEDLATLWLKLVNPRQLDRSSSGDELMLVPAIFFKPDRTNAGEQKIYNGEWRIAYSYPPRQNKKGAWRTPVEVWGEAACEFLALAARQPVSRANLPEVLQLRDGLTVQLSIAPEKLADKVFIDKIPKATR